MPTTLTRFTDEPLASDSAQFPLARPMRTPDNTEEPSPGGIRPWSLRGMAVLPDTGKRISVWRYDHERQMAVDADGNSFRELRMDPTAHSVTNNDGDEGPSEDWQYDYAPDTPFPPA